MWTVMHICGYVSVIVSTPGAVFRTWRRWNERTHRRCLERIARLELDLGVGLDWGREFFERRHPKLSPSGLRNQCWSCDEMYSKTWAPNRDPELAEHLCPSCERKTRVELSRL